jgi:pyruvate,water dikinase
VVLPLKSHWITPLKWILFIWRNTKKPSIVNVKNATGLLKNGDRVQLDAYKGIVRRIDGTL